MIGLIGWKHSICERPGYPKGAELLWRDARAEPLILLVGNGIKPMGQFSGCSRSVFRPLPDKRMCSRGRGNESPQWVPRASPGKLPK